MWKDAWRFFKSFSCIYIFTLLLIKKYYNKNYCVTLKTSAVPFQYGIFQGDTLSLSWFIHLQASEICYKYQYLNNNICYSQSSFLYRRPKTISQRRRISKSHNTTKEFISDASNLKMSKTRCILEWVTNLWPYRYQHLR